MGLNSSTHRPLVSGLAVDVSARRDGALLRNGGTLTGLATRNSEGVSTRCAQAF